MFFSQIDYANNNAYDFEFDTPQQFTATNTSSSSPMTSTIASSSSTASAHITSSSSSSSTLSVSLTNNLPAEVFQNAFSTETVPDDLLLLDDDELTSSGSSIGYIGKQ